MNRCPPILIRTRRRDGRWFGVAACAALLILWGWTSRQDQLDDLALQAEIERATTLAVAREQLRQQFREEQGPVILAAWRQGLEQGRSGCKAGTP